MHEYSIVQALIQSCQENAYKNGAKKVMKVSVKIGVMSGVEPSLLSRAFDMFKLHTICDKASLLITLQPIIIKCNSCNKESVLKKNEYSCLNCSSNDIVVLDGEEIYLMQLELE